MATGQITPARSMAHWSTVQQLLSKASCTQTEAWIFLSSCGLRECYERLGTALKDDRISAGGRSHTGHDTRKGTQRKGSHTISSGTSILAQQAPQHSRRVVPYQYWPHGAAARGYWERESKYLWPQWWDGRFSERPPANTLEQTRHTSPSYQLVAFLHSKKPHLLQTLAPWPSESFEHVAVLITARSNRSSALQTWRRRMLGLLSTISRATSIDQFSGTSLNTSFTALCDKVWLIAGSKVPDYIPRFNKRRLHQVAWHSYHVQCCRNRAVQQKELAQENLFHNTFMPHQIWTQG